MSDKPHVPEPPAPKPAGWALILNIKQTPEKVKFKLRRYTLRVYRASFIIYEIEVISDYFGETYSLVIQ